LLAVSFIDWLDLLGGQTVIGVMGKPTVSAPALEEEENNQELPKMPKEPTMAARTLEERELTGGNSPDKKRKEHADEELWREHRNSTVGIGDSHHQKHNEPEREEYAPHA
jgi:hypothetical protein